MAEKKFKFNRCTYREVPGDGNSAQCLREVHPLSQAHEFHDGQTALAEAEQQGKLRVELGPTAHKLSIVVVKCLDLAQSTAEELQLMRQSAVVIGCDGNDVVVLKSRQSLSSGGIEAVVDAAKAVGGIVTFGVGLIRIESQEDYCARVPR